MAGPIKISILANGSQARKELDGVAGTAQKIESKFSKFRLPATLALGAIGVGAKKAIDSASDLNETISKSQQIFGKQSAAIEKFASGAATSLGQSKQSALDAASTFGLIGQKAGLSGTETAKFATKFTGLASDLASFNNTTPEEAIGAIGAAMRGESEPIRKYGVLLDDATLKARAMKMGLIQTTKDALTPQQKALAASQEILAQTTKAQGDFARTSSGAANQSRINQARMENLSASLGQALLPAYTKALALIGKFVGFLSKHTKATQIAIAVIGGLAAAVLAASAATKVYNAGLVIYNATTKAVRAATAVWTGVQWALNVAMTANPIGLLIAAIAALVIGIVIAYKKSETFRNIVNKVFGAIKNFVVNAVKTVVDFIKKNWKKLVILLGGPIAIAIALIVKHWDKIKRVTKAAFDAVKDFIRDRLRAVLDFVRSIGEGIREKIISAWNVVRDRTRDAWQAVVTTIKDKITALVEAVRGIREKVLGLFANAGSWLYNAGKSIISGLIDGIGDMIGSLKDKLGSVTDLVPDWKGPPARDKKLLFKNGQLIMKGLMRGWDSQIPKMKKSLRSITGEIQGFDASLGTSGGMTLAREVIGGVSGSRGSTTYEITVNAPVGSSPEEIGRELSQLIDRYERSGGRRKAS